jgi:hypothetical protein
MHLQEEQQMTSKKTEKIVFDAALGTDDVTKALENLKARAERGEVSCIALRLFRPDGCWEDIAIGGTEEERANALEQLKRNQERAH